MKATKFIAAGVIGLIACTMLGACVHSSTGKLASGKRSEKSVDVAMFNKLSVSDGIEVIFVQGPQKPVEINCNEELIDRVIVKQKGKELEISVDREDGFYILDEKVRVSLQAEAAYGNRCFLGVAGENLEWPRSPGAALRGCFKRVNNQYPVAEGSRAEG